MPEPDMLDQSDIDALLSAVESGDLNDDQPPARIFSRFRRDSEKVEIRLYDFKRPERISKDQMRTLQTLHETFARGFGAQLSGFLRSIVEVRVATAEQMTAMHHCIEHCAARMCSEGVALMATSPPQGFTMFPDLISRR